MSSVYKPLSVLVISRAPTIPARLETILRDAAVVHEIHHVRGYLLALGALGEVLANQPPDVIVGDAAMLRSDVESTIEAISELSPTSNTVLIASDDDVDGLADTLAALNVTIVATSQSDEDLLKILTGSHAASAGASDSASDNQPDRGGSIDWVTGTPLPPSDTGLLAEMMNPHGNVVEHAIERLVEQCDLPGVAFTKECPSEGQVSTPVKFGEHVFGFVTANIANDDTDEAEDANEDANEGNAENESADTTKLQLWADWLAHWLAMDKQNKDLWRMAMRDELTGAWNRRYFIRFLERIVQHAADHRTSVTLMIFDIDDFKNYNDKYGHAAGDEILKETARLMQTTVRDQDVVARIGGDEFGVIFWDAEPPRRAGSRHPGDVRGICDRFRKMILAHRFPKLLDDAAGTLTISAGLAGYPWDAKTAEQLVERADAMAMACKREGKNAIKFGPGMTQNGG